MNTRKPYQPVQKASWWLENPFYRRYLIRELTSVGVLAYSILLLWGLSAAVQGVEIFTLWLANMRHPFWIVLHVVFLVAALFHAHTWFELTPKMVLVKIRNPKLMIKLQWLLAILVYAICLGVVAFLLLGSVSK